MSRPRRVAWVALGLAFLAYGTVMVPRAAFDDFGDFRQAGVRVLAGQSPYVDPHYLYAPVAAYLFVPLALVPPLWASAFWYLVNVAALAAIGILSLEAVQGSWRTATAASVALPLLATARLWTNNLEHGQTNIVLVLMLLVAYRLTSRARPASASADSWHAGSRVEPIGNGARTMAPAHSIVAGALIALAGTIKLSPFVSLLYFARRGAFSVVVAAVLAVAALWVVPLVRSGASVHAAELGAWKARTLERYGPGRSVGPGRMNQSVPAMSERIAVWAGLDRPAEKSQAPALALQLVIVGTLAWCLGRRPASPGHGAAPSRREFAAYAATLAAMPLLSGLSWKAHYIVLLPGWFVLLAPVVSHTEGMDGPRRLFRWVALGLGLGLILSADGLVGMRVAGAFHDVSYFTLVGLTMFAMLVITAVQEERS